MVDGGELIAIGARGAFEVLLPGSGRYMALAGGLFLSGCWARVDAAATAVEADVIIAGVDRRVIGVVDNVDVYVCDGAVVVEVVAAPVTARVADAGVAESIINATVEADLGSPVAGVPAIETASECPIAGSPEETDCGWRNPCTGHPVITVGSVGPVAGNPKVTGNGADGLRVDGQDGRTNANGNAHGDFCTCGARDCGDS